VCTSLPVSTAGEGWFFNVNSDERPLVVPVARGLIASSAVFRHSERRSQFNEMTTTTKDTKSTKMKFDEHSNRVSRGDQGHPRSPTVDLHEIGGDERWITDQLQRDKTERKMASSGSFSDSFVLFVSFVVK
jgi:hypothetical protein